MARGSGGGKLEQTRNFLELYLHQAGTSEVPLAYHKWACLSFLAACVRDRVWYEKFAEVKLTPHLYVFLIGESGTGKDIAARFALKLLHYNKQALRVYPGKTSAAALVDFLRKRERKQGTTEHLPPDPRIWLITTELANSIGTGGQADTFLKFMTDLYSGKDEQTPWRESTRYAGVDKKLLSPLINWLAGTTREWLCQVVTIEDIRGGFFARICPVEVPVTMTLRHYKPNRPWDYEEIREYLYDRVELYLNAEGVFELDEEAEVIDRVWYESRPAPRDDRLRPTWRRQHEQVLKLAQLYALCDWKRLDQPFIIRRPHIVKAQQDVAVFLKTTEHLLAYAATQNLDAATMLLVANQIKEHKAIRRGALLKLVYKEGVTSELLHRIEQTLLKAGEIRIHAPNIPGVSAANPVYVWTGGRRVSLKSIEPKTEEEETNDAPTDRDDND